MQFSRRAALFACLLLVLLAASACNKKSSASNTGFILVRVVDNDAQATPMPGVEITITPGNFVKKTDENGIAIFEVDPGDYVVNAQVCCAGPGFFNYHEPVSVAAGDTARVKLAGCSRCL
ncbi:MAG: carboxypeptidase regulatory-like domain-containing protein [Calditrichaeota bacterium]|nr:MAG: carboxypeptidase regulatory-like domain-containing protein [Calditrichota bacterium]